MKNILHCIIFLLAGIAPLKAQTLFGTTASGYDHGRAVINKLIASTNDLTVAFSLNATPATPMYTNFVQATNGKLYGMTSRGGANDAGVIFSYDPSTSIQASLWDLESASGKNPFGSLVQATDGKLYGMTNTGGSSDAGVIFSFDPASSTYTKLLDFDNTNGAFPRGSLVQAADGKLYGMTARGGSSNSGVIFSYDPSTSTFTNLRDFDAENGGVPYGSLIQAADGKLYGMTRFGGTSDAGIIFSFDPSTSTYLKLKDFEFINGVNPFGSLVQATDGKLYGLTLRGGTGDLGVIFSFNPSNSTYTKLQDFIDTNGATPTGSLIQASDGKLYGMTPFGGTSNAGIFFSFEPSTSTYSGLKDFDNINGVNPFGSLVLATDGKLYGLTSQEGLGSGGTIFSYDPSATAYTKLRDLSINENGSKFSGSLVPADNGKLYGMTTFGGSNDLGVIFSFDPSTYVYKKLKDFDVASGLHPYGSLVQADDGKLYGTAFGSGTITGVIFSLDPSSGTYTKLKDLEAPDGVGSGLIQARNGKLYGMTTAGGTENYGSIFSFDPSTLIYTRLKSFDNINGLPQGSLVQARDGKLYGMGISNADLSPGFIFSFDPLNSAYTVLKEFNGINGAYPLGSLIEASDGKLYGLTPDGGSNSAGNIFSFDPSTSSLVSLKDFQVTDGARPFGNLMQASDGKLYGMTREGGEYGLGVVFSYDPSTSTYTKLQDYNGANGASPGVGSAFIEITCTTGLTFYQDADGDNYGNLDSSVTACTQPTGYVTDSTDCNDKDQAVHGPANFYRDADGDSYGSATDSLLACVKPAGYVSNNDDCNDNNRAVNSPVTFYRDADFDGFGDSNSPISVCKNYPPRGYVRNNLDCNDASRELWIWNEKIKMCYNGTEVCVRIINVFRKLRNGWTLGQCPADCNNDNSMARSTSADAEDETAYSKHSPAPLQYKLSNYPNPFTGTSTIRYELPVESRVSIRVYDVLGRAVATLVDGEKKAGAYSVNFNAGRLASGALYYRIIARSKNDRFEQTNQMIKIK